MLHYPPNHPADLLEAALQRCRTGFRALVEARAYAADVGDDSRCFSLDLAELSAAGLQPRDLRWLLAKGYIVRLSAGEAADANRLRPRAARPIDFDAADRFVATEEGIAFWMRGPEASTDADARSVVAVIGPAGPIHANSESRPHWDAQRRELRVGETVVKRFRQPSPLQELLLTAFEEEGWPQRIADPLPRHADQEPKRRLHDTIRSLNLNQRAPLVRFGGDGTGEGVIWEWTEAAEQPIVVRPRLRKAA